MCSGVGKSGVVSDYIKTVSVSRMIPTIEVAVSKPPLTTRFCAFAFHAVVQTRAATKRIIRVSVIFIITRELIYLRSLDSDRNDLNNSNSETSSFYEICLQKRFLKSSTPSAWKIFGKDFPIGLANGT